MRITLCTPEIHAELVALFDNNPELNFQNDGYEYLHPDVREAHAEQIARIEDILREHVAGFYKTSPFFNFCMQKKGIVMRFDYDWGYDGGMHFSGVGYLGVDELRDGFEKRRKANEERININKTKHTV